MECSPYIGSLVGGGGEDIRGEFKLVSDNADSDRGRWVEEPYDEPRRSSIPFRPPDRPPMEGLWGIGNPREST
jgi:hypothetical protein